MIHALILLPILAAAPPLETIDDPALPLTLKAPKGYDVKVKPIEKGRDLPSFITMDDRCGQAALTVYVQHDKAGKSGGATIKKMLDRAKLEKKSGVECASPNGHETFCAGAVKGVPGIVSVYFSSGDDASFQDANGPAVTVELFKSLAFKKGKTSKDLTEWQREVDKTKDCGK